MKHSFKRLISLFLSAALLLALLPTVTVTAAAGSVTLDFNGTDFSTALNGNGFIAPASAVSAVTDTSSVPTGFTGGVYAGGDANYAASAVGFSHPVDLSKITSVKLRFYIKDYSYSGSPDLRVIDTSENPSSGYYSLGLPTFGEWNEVELIDALNSSSIRKNADGYLERFVIGFRTRAVTTVWFDSLTITYTDDFYIGSEEEDDVGTSVFDFNGSDFATDYTSGSTFGSSAKATGVNDTASVPAGFTGGVYAGGDTAYGAVAIDFAAPLDLSKITSFKIRLYVPSYSYSSAPVVRLFNEASTSGGYTSNAFVADRGGNFDRWCEIELLDLLQSNTIRKDVNGHLDSFIFTIRCYASSGFVCYFDSVIIQHTDGFMVEQEEDPSKITLTYAGGGSQNHESRYLLYFDGLKNTADIYWNNNTVYVDGEARSGEGVNYVPLNGQLGLCLKYEHLESGATLVSDLKQPHILHIRAGTPLGNDGQYTIANDVWLRLDGTSITELKPIELTYASGAAQDTENRYLVRFDGITDTSDIYWSNNTVYVDGEAKSGDGVNYVPLSGQLALCLKYT
ncbi:MAG: hypothetical protein IIX68_00695, partial [Clostridia bacterium]|nr:hypothetical protein [Clostridia bacterium]